MNETRDDFYAYGPKEVDALGIGKQLKFIYLAHCNGGAKHNKWAEVFYPAKVQSFNRISIYPEHVYWLWYKLPGILDRDL